MASFNGLRQLSILSFDIVNDFTFLLSVRAGDNCQGSLCFELKQNGRNEADQGLDY